MLAQFNIKKIYSILEKKIIQKGLIFCLIFMIYPPPFFLASVDIKLRICLRIISFLLIFFIYIINIISKKKISRFFIITSIFLLYLLIITLLKSGDIYKSFGIIVITIAEFMLYEFFLDSKLKKNFIEVCYFYYIFIIIFSVLFHFINTNLIINVNRNHYIQYIFPLLFFEYYISINYDNKLYIRLRYFSLISVIFLSILAGSMTGIVVVAFAYLYLYYIGKKEIKLLLINNWKFQFILLLLFFMICVWFGDLNPIPDIISMIFGKGKGFSYRTNLVIYARETILKSPLFGYGVRNLQQVGFLDYAGNAHNFFLQYLA